MEPVNFVLMLKEDADAHRVKSKLEQIASDFSLTARGDVYMVVGTTNQATYERVFDAKLKYVQETVKNLNHGPSTRYVWREERKGQIPTSLAGEIDELYLDNGVVLTD